MTAPSNANTSGLVDLIKSRIGQDFEGECHLAEHEAREIISTLVTAASAQARIAELSEQNAAFLDLHNDMSNRMVAAEARADRLAKVVIDLKAAFGDPMTRRALGGHNEKQMAAILSASAALQQETQP